MKLAIATIGDSVSEHFGKCDCFTVVEISEGKVINKTVLDTSKHLHGELVPFLKENQIDVILSGGMGSGALEKVNANKILAYIDVKGQVEEVIKDYLSGKLTSD